MKASESQLRRSLRASTLDATFDAAKIGCGELYFAAFALLLGATPFQVGVLATVPILLGSVFQLLSTVVAHRIGDRVWVIGSAALQAAVFVPIVLLARVASGGYPWLLAWVCIYWMLNLGVNPAWNAWMGRMIPPVVRSRYFGRRNVAVHSLIFLSLLLGGFLIDAASRTQLGAATGFAAAFTIAAVSRAVSVWFLTRQHDPGPFVAAEHRVATRTLLPGFWKQPYGRLIGLMGLISGAVNISMAYFTPYFLHALNLSYARFTILGAAIVVARVLSSSYWGEIARIYGNRRALQVSAVLIIPLSSLWVVSDNFGYQIALQLVGGFAWAGFELTTFLNLFDCTEDRNRAQVLSIYNLFNGVMIVTGSMLGGAVMHAVGDAGYHPIFIISSMCRALIVVFLARGVSVKRRGGEHSFRDVFTRVVTLRPSEGDDVGPVVIDEEPRRQHRES